MKIQVVRYNNKLMLTLKDKGFICVIMSGTQNVKKFIFNNGQTPLLKG